MRRWAVILLLLLSQLAAPSAQFGVLGRGLSRGASTAGAPCDLVSGCVAAYSMQRKMLAAYSGSMFRLRRTSDSTFQDIGLVSGAIDQTTINTFCGVISSSGRTTTTANGCEVDKIYDQSGNGNDLAPLRPDYIAACRTRYTVDTGGKPIWISDVNANHCFLGTEVPVGAPTGNDAASIYMVADDKLMPVEESPFNYTATFGMMHRTTAACCQSGSDFDLGGGGGYRNNVNFGSFDYLTLRVDTENDIADLAIGIADRDATEVAMSPNLASFSYVGPWVGFTSYDPSTSNIEMDWQNGRRHGIVNYNSTNVNGQTGLKMGAGTDGAHLAEIRIGWTGDQTSFDPAAFYEGAIYKATLTLTQGRQLEANAQTFYSIATPTTCSNGGIDLIGGIGTVTGAWGLRQLDPARYSGTVVIVRADNGALKALGSINGTCNPDVSAVSGFCGGTTCHIYDLPNQVVPDALVRNGAWGASGTPLMQDAGRFTSGGSATTGPTFTLNGLNGTLPVITCGGSDVLTSFGSTNAVTRPYTIAAAAKRTSTGGTLFQDGAGTNLLYNGGANLLGVQSSSGTQTLAATDGTFHAVAGTVPDNTHITAYVNGSPSTSGVVTTGNTASSTWKLCNGWTGALTEAYLINGTDAGATALGNLSTLQRAIGGY